MLNQRHSSLLLVIIAREFGVALVLAMSLTWPLLADGTVTTPTNIAPTTWKIASVNMVTGSGGDTPGVTITLHYFDASPALVQTTQILLTNAEIASFFTTTNSAVAGESGTAVKRYRQRVTKWLVDNGKITNVTPE
jgi:hypothetical protein